MAQKVLIATIVYGDYIEYFEKVCLRSLFQKGNIPHLVKEGYDIEYVIYTKENEDIEKLEGVVARNRGKGFNFVINARYGNDNGAMIREMIELGMERDAFVFSLNPDFFFCDNALKNLVSYKFKNKMCVAATHVRVNDSEFLDKISKVKGNVSAPKLVNMAMECLHPSWKDSFVSNDSNNSWITGSALQQISEKMWVATFRIPTVFFAKFEPSDHQFFTRFDLWDHQWPTKLMEENRFKFNGSSDFFFAVELTKTGESIPQCEEGKLWNDDFHVGTKHAEVNRNFLVTLRGQ